MKVGIVVDNELFFDVRVLKEIDILQRHGHEVFALCLDHGNTEKIKALPFVVKRMELSRKKKNRLFFFQNLLPFYENLWAKAIATFIAEFDLEVIHTHDLYMSKAARNGINKSQKNIPLILDLHENFPEAVLSYQWTQGFLRNLLARPLDWRKKEGAYLKAADEVIVLSEGFKKELLSRYLFLKSQQITAFPNVINFTEFDSYTLDDSLTKPQGTVLLYFGMVGKRRGIFEAMEALATLVKKEYDVSLWVVGPVDKPDLHRFSSDIKKLKIEENVVHVPWVHLSELPSYLAKSDICLAPFEVNKQHESGIANKIFQYLYGGKPIVASNCKPQRELIEAYNCGRVFTTQASFVAALEELISQPKLARELGENGRRKLLEDYAGEAYENKLLSIYRRLN